MRFEKSVQIAKAEIDRVNALLSTGFCSEPTDEELLRMGAKGFFTEGIFCVTFADGSSINFDLCADSYDSICTDSFQKVHCFYDQVTWTNADGTREIGLDCAYAVEDIEVDIDDNTYVVHIEEV